MTIIGQLDRALHPVSAYPKTYTGFHFRALVAYTFHLQKNKFRC